MVMATPDKIVSFDADPQSAHSAFQQFREKGREYLDQTVTAAQEHPWAAAAIGAGVVATVAATAYGATVLSRRNHDAEDAATIDEQALPPAIPLE